MEEDHNKEALRRQYILGTLSEGESLLLEESYLVDNDAFEEMETTEAELVEAYVRNELPAVERARMKDRLLESPRLLERAKFASTLSELLAERQGDQAIIEVFQPATGVLPDHPRTFWKRLFGRFFSVPPNTFGVGLAAFAVLLLAFGALLFVQWQKLRDQQQKLAGEQAAIEQQKRSLGLQSSDRARVAELNAELEKQKEQLAKAESVIRDLRQAPDKGQSSGGQSLPAVIASITLFPGSLRSTGEGSVLTARRGEPIMLTLDLEANDYPRYQVAIKDSARKEVFHQSLRARSLGSGKALLVQLSGKHLDQGDYAIKVSGVTSSGALESVADYNFRLIIK